jgi:histidinol-phosphatase
MSPDPDLALALSLADAADEISSSRYRATDLVVETKPDLTPVTEADRAIEKLVQNRLAAERPQDGILGEEFGEFGDSRRRWIVDPIDGTRNFSRGVPVWATLIALEDSGRIRLGVVSAPALGHRWWAIREHGAYANGRPIRVSAVDRLEDAALSLAVEDGVLPLATRCWHPRGYGDFWSHMLVAEGAIDGAVDAVGVAVWDVAAIQVIVEEAGGRFTDRTGAVRIDGLGAVSSNGHLHDVLLAGLATPQSA